MSTPSTTQRQSASANRGRGRGGNRSVPRAPAAPMAASVPVSAFPPALPPRIQRLIDGVLVKSVCVSYTKYGASVLVVKGDGSQVPLETYEAQAKAERQASEYNKDAKMYRDRVAERQLQVPPAAQAINVVDRPSLERWLQAWKGADPASFKILSMNARNFRAQKGANAVGQAASSGTTAY